jgi:SSS family solute:Na+ symporter
VHTGISTVDLAVILVVMVGVTWLGHRLSRGVTSRRSFFQADGTLPWWAVSASIIATLVSAVTFVAVPANVFADGGDLKYFQVILGLALGKIAVGMLLAKPFYESKGLNTSYEYIGARLDPATGEVSMYLGLVLNIINSGVKLLTASLVLDVISGWGLLGCASFVVAISILWSALAGIKTVIWTDFLLFVFFSLGALFVVVFVVFNIDMSVGEGFRWLDEQAKWVLFDFSTEPEKRYTIWAGVIGGIALNIATGSTQGTWQRIKACRSVTDAQAAYNWAALFYVVHIVILGVGLALAVFYADQGMTPDLAAQLAISSDRVFPYFVITEMPVGLSGLFIAAIFAAAISTLDSALTEAADLSVSHIYLPYIRPNAEESHYVLVARLMMFLWGGVFLAVSLFFAAFQGEGLLDLTFKLPNYVYGAILGSIVLARFGIGRFRTVMAGIALATAITYGLSQAGVAFFYWSPVAGLSMILFVWLLERTPAETSGIVR